MADRFILYICETICYTTVSPDICKIIMLTVFMTIIFFPPYFCRLNPIDLCLFFFQPVTEAHRLEAVGEWYSTAATI